MALAFVPLPFIRISNASTGGENYVTIDAYHDVWYNLGWRSPLDDPGWAGGPAPVEPTNFISTANSLTVVNHGAVAATARPTNAAVVYWIGSVVPTNAAAYDLWYNTA